MKTVVEFVGRGGPVVIAIMLLSVALYASCFDLFLGLRSFHRRLREAAEGGRPEKRALRRLQIELNENFAMRRATLGSMIAAAPLLGLLGTVNGMAATFDGLAGPHGRNSMDGLAKGISEVLVATESGLAVAIPAALFIYYAHRLTQKNLKRLVDLERTVERRGVNHGT